MEYIQLIPPNMGTKGIIALCLSFAEDVFSAPHLFPNATVAWNATTFKHRDQNFPKNVAVLAWWSCIVRVVDTLGNVSEVDEGHVAIRLADGRFLSSPWQKGTTQAIIGSMAQMESIYHLGAFQGWSEDIATLRVVKESNMPSVVSADEVKWLAQGYFTPAQVEAMGGLDKLVADNTGTESNTLIKAWANSPQFVEKRLHYEALDTGDGTAVVLKPGKYQVN